MTTTAKVITVFGSSRPRPSDAQYSTAQALGSALAAKGFVVCTGGYAGVMEAVSRSAKEAGGRTIGITTSFFQAHANRWVDEEISVPTWQDRLFALIHRGDGYVVCPGGTGTLAELAVVWEMLSKGVMVPKPFVVLGDFWLPIIARVHEAELDQQPELLTKAESPSAVADCLTAYFSHPAREADDSVKLSKRQ